ncbi:porin family protein [Carboxylicivirga marina]|uniref:porin family protein n=1 Tax=Carboxylicivirga marina TaxID=2800988 RepID=UPI0025971D24|nr:porin family protein [uncultured Carboxylicivirga sp.]
MKKIFTIITLSIICVLSTSNILAQEKTKSIVTVEEKHGKSIVKAPGVKVEVDEFNDTITKITIGTRRFEIIEDYNRARVRMVRVPREKFKGHWAGCDIGFNGYLTSDFSTDIPAEDNWMDLNASKSVTFSINFLQYNIGLQRHKNNFGMVLGAGWTFYNYRTDLPYTFERDPNTGETIGVPVDPARSVEKNKITASFINIPLLFEWQIPASEPFHRFYISAGPYCGFKLGSHTKIVYKKDGDRSKDKGRGDINLTPFQYGAMVRLGYRFINLYASYNFSTFYTENRGPELYPFTIGLSLVQF